MSQRQKSFGQRQESNDLSSLTGPGCRSSNSESQCSRPNRGGFQEGLGLAHVSKPTGRRLLRDEAEIRTLENKLGLEGRKGLPKSFQDDGLAPLLDGLSDLDSDGDDKPAQKRQRVETPQLRQNGQEIGADQHKLSPSRLLRLFRSSTEEVQSLSRLNDVSSSFLSSSNELADTIVNSSPPGVAISCPQVSGNVGDLGRRKHDRKSYAPPARGLGRGSVHFDELRRRLQGFLNRLSTSNILTIVSDVAELYESYPSKTVTALVGDLILERVLVEARLDRRFTILVTGFSAALYRIIGVSFGIHITRRLVRAFDTASAARESQQDCGKQLVNLVSTLACLYNFQVIGRNFLCSLLQDLTRGSFEQNVELLFEILNSEWFEAPQRSG